MKQYRGYLIWGITAIVIFFFLAGILAWAGANRNGIVLENPAAAPVLYREQSAPAESSGAVPDTDSNDEGMQDLEKEPTVINL